MSDEIKSKEKSFEFPMMPLFGLDLGRELGALDARLARVENDIVEIKHDIKALDDRLRRDIKLVDDRVDRCLVAINRIDERMKNLMLMGGGVLAAVVAGLALQYLNLQ